MVAFLEHFFRLGALDADERRRAWVLLACMGGTAVLTVLAATLSLATNLAVGMTTLPWYAGWLLLQLGAMAIVRRGHWQLGGVLFTATFYGFNNLAALRFGGILSSAVYLNIAVVAAMSLVLGRWGPLLGIIAAVAAGLFQAYATIHGWATAMPPNVNPMPSRVILLCLDAALIGGMLAVSDRTVRDALTTARNAEQATNRTSRALNDMFRSMADALVLVAEDGNIVQANPAANALFRRADLEGRAFRELFRDAPVDGEDIAYDVDGSPIDVLASRGEVIAASGSPSGVVWVIRDIRQRKEAERKIQEAAAEAQAANNAKSQFLANMSHELRTPLNAIIGYSEILREEVEDPANLADLERIETSGKQLLGLIDDVLDLSKVESGRMELFPQRFDIGSLCVNAIAAVTPLAHKNANRLTTKISSGEMVADPRRVQQILQNLLSNAAKFTKGGEITLTVSSEGPWVVFDVHDTGIGIPPDVLERLFMPFTQADGSSTRRHGGTGLGLSLVARFSRAMGGDVTAQSALGAGSTFRVRLPQTYEATQNA